MNALGRNAAWLLLLGTVAGCGPSATAPTADDGGFGTATAGEPAKAASAVELLNVSYDPTRELWKQFNEQFIVVWKKKTGQDVTFKMSHGGSSKPGPVDHRRA